ncbi:Stk1 family PASTA domain-containing Ser/Thr kinase [Bacilliculturomica massiliensis]|uniref:Stk1 family PASTA domain-containing Ser/Thr kinase n=1 Tax=Bacilliculturomica massiliensis TaxID=1917867 RepID=UPI001030D7F8|nr:Stk1 family PASTA domain-containing Ser/Thr kinase [Bacilliculturomica massiliensis]
MSSRILAGRYELIEKVGEGGMAVVYKARDRLLNRFVAVKILKPEFTKDLKFIESFRRESQAAASLTHPNIVNVYDVGKEGNIHYIVMEYIEGKVLSDLVREEGAMDPRKAVSVAKQIASALSLAHKNHIIHRDVKPHNILMTEDGVAKITDFGIAKAISNATIVGNQTGTIMGSVHYFSPEQARGGYVDEKSDIYSLGIVLYEMLTGKVPFDADNPVAVAVMHMNEEMVPPSQIVPSIPPDVEAIVMKATSKYQVNRYKSADEMLTALNLANYHPAVRGGSETDETALTVTPGQKVTKTEPKEGVKEDMGKDKKKKKFRINKLKMGAIILALVCAVPLSGLIYAGIQNLTAPKVLTVPDLRGKTEAEATAELEEMGLKLQVDLEVNSDEYEAGQIVSQTPKAEAEVKEGKTITVNISKGQKGNNSIPDITGSTISDAEYKLEQYGFVLGSTTEESSDRPKGIILDQNPKSGTEAEKGARVNVTVSSGEDTSEITMPNLIGFDLDKAKDEIVKAGLKLGSTDKDYSSAYAKNKVIDQSVAGGATVARGTAIDLTISKGAAGQVNSVAIDVPFDKAKNDIFNMSVIVSLENGQVSTPISSETRYKEDGSEILSVSGSGKGTVQIWFDNELVLQYTIDFDSGEVK